MLIVWTVIGVAFHVWVGLDKKGQTEYADLEELVKKSLENIDVATEIKADDFAPIRDFDMEWEWESKEDMSEYDSENDKQ